MVSRPNGHEELTMKAVCEAAGVPLGFGVDQHFTETTVFKIFGISWSWSLFQLSHFWAPGFETILSTQSMIGVQSVGFDLVNQVYKERSRFKMAQVEVTGN